ncbi:MAG: CoA-binding protein [Myxococcota bacterium]
MADPASVHDLRDILSTPKRIAVLGAHPDEHRAAYYVPKYLKEQGWTVIGINPTRAGEAWLGGTILASLEEAGPVDLIDVFRRSEALADHRDEFLAAGAPIIWFQLGIENEAVATDLRAAGLRVIQDRCMLADHRALIGKR